MPGYYDTVSSCTAFVGGHMVASGTPREVAAALKELALETDDAAATLPLVFDDATGRPVEFDLRGSLDDVLARVPEPAGRDRAGEAPHGAEAPGVSAQGMAAPAARRGPGRPRLGVVAREVTLLPRHWEWLAAQPGGASVTLRKLVEAARKDDGTRTGARVARDAAYRVMLALAGDEPGFEEATRALFAGAAERFTDHLCGWPEDVRAYVQRVAAPSFDSASGSSEDAS